jgi:hypothetical protein
MGVLVNAGTIQLLTNNPGVVAVYELNPLKSLIQDDASSTTGPENEGVIDPVEPTAPILNAVLIEFAFCALRFEYHSITTTKLITRSVNRCDWCAIACV